MYWSLQGKCYIATRQSNGDAAAFRYMYDCDEVSFSMSTDIYSKPEHNTGQRLTALRIPRNKDATMRVVMAEPTKENIALAVQGTAGTIAAGTVTGEPLPSGLIVGDIAKTQKPKISSVVVKDSAGSPVTLVANTDYRLHDAAAGMIEILNIGAYTQPFKVDYSNAPVDNIPMFTLGLTERWFRFVGVDTADLNKKKMIDFYRVSFDPVETMQLITEEHNTLPMNGGVLYDATKVADPVLGQFGRVVILET